MIQKMQRKPRNARGFTLTEIMVVVFIIGLLTTAVVLNIGGATTQARVTKAKADLSNISNALSMYNLQVGSYPSERQGLEALIQRPDDLPNSATYQQGGFIAKLPNDPWGRPYVYKRPGDDNRPFSVYSFGADGKEGGEELDADIGNWD